MAPVRAGLPSLLRSSVAEPPVSPESPSFATASEIADRLRNILCILGGVTENKKTDAQRDFEAMNLALRRKDDLLAANGLRSIQDILDFCKTNGLKSAEKPGDLHWFLVFGKKHD